MLRKRNKLKRLERKIARSFKRSERPEVALLPEGQMLISKNMIPNPAFEQGGKQESYVPASEGYEIYVACRSQEAYEAVATTGQRIGLHSQPTPWKSDLMQLQVDRESLFQDWRILNRDKQVVSVSVHAGSERVLQEVNQILNAIAHVLLG
jgi:hypothetical protein